MKTNDCRTLGARIAGIWVRWFIWRGCSCAGCQAIQDSQVNLDYARRLAARELMLS